MKIIKIKESEIKSVVSQILRENEARHSNYMFFSNLEQIERQCKLLRNMDPNMIDEILNNGHDWADDHVTEAKVNMDQVFDFIMNETKGSNADEPVNANMNQFSLNESGEINEKCWDGYKSVGSKMKNGKRVPNCVPTNEATSAAQQAAIAINMKKNGKTPKNESYGEIDESKNCPTDPGKWAASKAAAKAKFDVYPSAYANGWAAKNYKSKGGGWKKCK
jgi:hypothetical protein